MLLPEVAEAQSLNHTNKISRNASVSLSFCLSIGILCTGIFLYYGMDMGVLFFKNEMAGQFIRNLAWLCPFLYIATTMGSILNGMGKTSLTFTNSLISLIVQLAFIIFGIPRFGIGAYLVGMLVSELTLCFLHLEAVNKNAVLSFQPIHQLARPLCAFFLSYWITQTFTGSLYRQFPFHPMAKLLVSAGAVSGIYLLLLILTAGWERK